MRLSIQLLVQKDLPEVLLFTGVDEAPVVTARPSLEIEIESCNKHLSICWVLQYPTAQKYYTHFNTTLPQHLVVS